MTTDEQTRTNKGKRVRLTLEITPELQQRLKPAAAEHNQTVQGYAEELLDQGVPRAQSETLEHQEPISNEWYGQLLALREAIAQAYPGKVFEDSTEIIRQMREERSQELENR